MDNSKMKKQLKKAALGIKNAVLYSVILAAIFSIIAVFVALIGHRNIIRSIYMSYYYGGSMVLMMSIPQLYRRNKTGKIKKGGMTDALIGFYGMNKAYEGEEDEKDSTKLTGEGFWLGMLIFITGLVLLGFGIIGELIFFK